MTTDKAISVLTALKTEHNSELTDEAVDMAINAIVAIEKAGRDLVTTTFEYVSICMEQVKRILSDADNE